MKYLFLILTFCLAACSTTGEYESKLNGWIGKNETELVAAWGAPDRQYAVDANTRIFSYLKRNAVVYSGAANETESLQCETLFTLVKGKIARWGHRGNDCRSG